MSYASAVSIRREVARAARPQEHISVSEAATRHLRLHTDSGGSEPWNPDLTPYMVEPMDRLIDRRYEAVIFIGPARTGKTGALLGFLAYIITCDPSDAMVLHMSQDKAGKFSKKDLRRMYRESPTLGAELTGRASDNNVFEKTHRSGNVLYIGWPSASQLSGETIKYMAITDMDRMSLSVEGEGSPFLMAKKRTQTFLSRGRTYVETSPGYEVTDPKYSLRHPHEAPPAPGAVALYNQGTMCRRYLPCPHCGEYFMEPSDFSGFSFAHNRDLLGATIPEAIGKVRLICTANGCLIDPSHKQAMSRAGLWVPAGGRIEDGRVVGEPRDAPYASYWLTGVSAAYQEWESIVRAYLQAEFVYDTTADEEPLRNTYNLDMGMPYLSRSLQATRDSNSLTRRKEEMPRRVVPHGVRFILAAVDIQGGRDRRFVVQMIGYGEHLESWIIDRFNIRYLDADDDSIRLDMSTHVEHWDVLIHQVIDRTYPLADGSGRHLPVHLTVCDTGGEDGVTDRAYAFYRSLRQRSLSNKLMLVKGASGRSAPKLEERYPDTTKRKDRNAESRGDVPVWFINTNTIKDIINNNMGRTDPGPGYMHWPAWLGTWFFDELTAEKRKDDGTWEQVSPRNEAFDLYTYAHAGLIRLGADKFNWQQPRTWAADWDDNPEIVLPDSQAVDPLPRAVAPTARPVRFRQKAR